MKQFSIDKKTEGQRIDKFLKRILSNSSPAFVYKMLRKKNITLNDKKAYANTVLKAGDIVKIYFSDSTFDNLSGSASGDISDTGYSLPANIDLTYYKGIDSDISFKSSIVYEDDNLIIINKPAGILSQKAEAGDISLNEYVLFYLMKEKKITADDLKLYKPSTVNRLDRNTSGITLCALNLKAAALISSGLKERTINKYYKCAVAGDFNKEGLHKGYLTKDSLHNIVTISDKKVSSGNGTYIETEYELLERHDGYCILSVHLITGKPHQIRAHLAHLGFAIIGDSKYGDALVNRRFNKNHQLLHAYKIVFPEYDDEMLEGISGKTFLSDIDFIL